MNTIKHTMKLAVLTVGASATLALSACGSDAKHAATPTTTATSILTTVSSSPETTPASAPGTTAPASTDPATTAAPTTAAPTTVAPTTEAPTTTTLPDALQQVPGVVAVGITVGGDDPTRPTFTWTAPANAASYQLVVQDATGVPVWGWTGTDTTIVLGGVVRAADAEGPTLTGPSRVRVYAFGADSSPVAVSPWVALAG